MNGKPDGMMDPRLALIVQEYAQMCAVLDKIDRAKAFAKTLREIRALPEVKA